MSDFLLHCEFLEGKIHVLLTFVSATMIVQRHQVLSVRKTKNYCGLLIQGDDDFSKVDFFCR